MGEVDNRLKELIALRDEIDERQKLEKTGGGGYNGGMDGWETSVETRLGSLEKKVDDIIKTLTDIRVDLAGIKGSIGGLPTKAFVIGTLISLLALSVGCFMCGANVVKSLTPQQPVVQQNTDQPSPQHPPRTRASQ